MIDQNKNLPKVLVIDDDDTIRMLAEEFLSQAGFVVSEAENGLQALEILDSVEPDIILLDVEMPQLNGFATCARLRQMPRYSSTPILMLTGLHDSDSIDRAFHVGATEFATKPINWTLLRHRLRYMLRASKVVNQLAKSQDSLIAAQRIARLGNWAFDINTSTLELSDQLYTLFGIEKDQVSVSLFTLLETIHQDDRDSVKQWITEATNGIDVASINHRIVRGDGSTIDVTQQLEAVLDSNGKVTFLQGILQDVTERRKAEEEIYRLAYYDNLTSLPNRELFKTHLERALYRAKNNERLVAVLFVDMDDFKKINDTFGHAVGDLLLQEVGRRLVKSVRGNDKVVGRNFEQTIARMGGDEYTILLSKISDPEEAKCVAQRILDNLSKPYKLDGNDVYSTPSVGIAVYPKNGKTSDELLKNADMAMYSAKRGGKNLFMMHDEVMSEEVQKLYTLDSQLRGAMGRDEFSLHYQPQLDLSSGKMDGIEVLLRWDNIELGSVSPVEFIPIAEENGFIVCIGEWVMRTACYAAKKWLDEGYVFERIAVNVSALQFVRPDFPDLVAQILEETQLDPSSLELEITESLLAADTENAVNTLRKLKALGVQLSIDDFGTGYSSLSQLKNFPIDRLKIDRSFIQGITSSLDDAAIANAIISMGNSMNLQVLAEGVETEEQLEFLKNNNCDEVQGYYFSRPLPTERMIEFLQEQYSAGNSSDSVEKAA